LVLDAEGRTSGSAIVLDGTRHWEDYRAEARVASVGGTNIVLMARHDTVGNTVGCNYGKDYVHIQEVMGGAERVIGRADNPSLFVETESEISIAIEVRGNLVRCYKDGELVAEASFDPSIARGGVGFKTWNGEGNARATVRAFSAREVE
jgi:hypothetical protein